jgi:carbonic anhydrase
MDDAPFDLLDAAARHAGATVDPGAQAPPRRRLAILTCMDARILPHAMLGLGPGDLHVIRNAGARATDDAVRSLMLSTRLLGARQVAVIAHTKCGNTGTDDEVAEKLVAAGVTDPPRPLHATPDLEQAVRDDVVKLRTGGRLAEGTTVDGFVYDVETGELRAVAVTG